MRVTCDEMRKEARMEDGKRTEDGAAQVTEPLLLLLFVCGLSGKACRTFQYESEHTTSVHHRSVGSPCGISFITSSRAPVFSPKTWPGRGPARTGRGLIVDRQKFPGG